MDLGWCKAKDDDFLLLLDLTPLRVPLLIYFLNICSSKYRVSFIRLFVKHQVF